jgi:opacity protein-like surface antigen
MNRKVRGATLSHHLAGISVVALLIAQGAAAPVSAQTALPTIDVGGARQGSRSPTSRKLTTARVQGGAPRVSQPAPGPTASGPSDGNAAQVAAAEQKFNRDQQASSALFTTGKQIMAVPFSRPAEALETAMPGLIITQHSGEGKANQYQLRGFQLDHGTDLALWVDGMPLNMVTHGHGQGYADANFIIPELISYVESTKGPYYAKEGDFSSAGSIHVQYKDVFDQGLFSTTVGSFGYVRQLAIKSSPLEGGNILNAIELGTYNGPWTLPDRVSKINGVMRWTQGTQDNGLSLTAMAYANRWHASNQIPERAVTEGIISLWGNLNPTDRGDTTRFSVSGRWSETDATSHSRIEAYAAHTTLDLFNDFDYWLTQPVLGDQFRQFDRRTTLGMQGEHGRKYDLAGFPAETRVGINSRYDNIRVGLQDTFQTGPYDTITNDQVAEGSVGIWTDTTVHWTPWLRTVAGIRGDFYAASVGDYQNPLAAPTGLPYGTPGASPIWTGPWNSGRKTAALDSPKASIIVGPWKNTEFFFNFGQGFHSNDARGTVASLDPTNGSQIASVPLLTKSHGAEIGARTKFLEGLDSTITFWWLNFDSEAFFNGDSGTTNFGRPSRRYGVELTNRYSPTDWLHFNANLALTQSRYRGVDQPQVLTWLGLITPDAAPYFTYLGNAAGNYIPEAPPLLASIGLDVGKSVGWFGALKYRYKAAYPLTEDGYLRAPASGWLNLSGGYRWENGLKLQADIFNAVNSRSDQITYGYGSLLPTEPLFASCVNGIAPSSVCAIGQMDRQFKPMEPIAVRITLAGPISAGAFDPILAPNPNARSPWRDFLALAYDEPEESAGGSPNIKGPAQPSPPIPVWTGLYAGVNGGVSFGGNNTYASTAPIGIGADPAVALFGSGIYGESNGGFVGGGQIGYNYQTSKRTVVGLETDLQWTSGGSGTSTLQSAGPSLLTPGSTVFGALTATQRLDWIGTARGRAGFVFLPNAMLYATAGLAYGQSNLRAGAQTISVDGVGGIAGFTATSASTAPTRVGWTVGGGVEWLFSAQWSVKAEYSYFDLGNVAVAAPQLALAPGAVAANLATQFRARADGQIFKGGLNYHLNWDADRPVVAKY